jgi:hypothetical protein
MVFRECLGAVLVGRGMNEKKNPHIWLDTELLQSCYSDVKIVQNHGSPGQEASPLA